ncbi:hypothetical protein DBV15_04419 [Temnothorax longispinosus]|uniref:Uncharacterized protein n=1 Tax=Temnothorax longispinosus TaxID=300112 RepID=A0A4S2K8N6_9HYME|nr:hypothetical protein DBV15_04419 [Temnothorax longispinosus]
MGRQVNPSESNKYPSLQLQTPESTQVPLTQVWFVHCDTHEPLLDMRYPVLQVHKSGSLQVPFWHDCGQRAQGQNWGSNYSLKEVTDILWPHLPKMSREFHYH